MRILVRFLTVALLALYCPAYGVAAEIRVMTWNLEDMDIFDGGGEERVTWQEDAEAGIAATIRSVDPDMLLITEAPSFVELEFFISRNLLDYELIHFRQQSGRRDYADSMAILHRMGAAESRYMTPLVPGSDRSESSAYLDWSYRGLLVAEFEGLTVIGVHLKSPWDGKERSYTIRSAQARALVEFVDDITGPILVLGDINDSPGIDSKERSFSLPDTISILETSLIRASGSEVSQEKGFNLDHIFIRDGAISNRNIVATDWAWSDHRPVWADVLY